MVAEGQQVRRDQVGKSEISPRFTAMQDGDNTLPAVGARQDKTVATYHHIALVTSREGPARIRNLSKHQHGLIESTRSRRDVVAEPAEPEDIHRRV